LPPIVCPGALGNSVHAIELTGFSPSLLPYRTQFDSCPLPETIRVLPKPAQPEIGPTIHCSHRPKSQYFKFGMRIAFTLARMRPPTAKYPEISFRVYGQ